ncbi:MAG: PKD domain-containing protein [Bacteroidales bacterium]|nr:PKD domain-containing protein [Bacteroidales bacterium]
MKKKLLYFLIFIPGLLLSSCEKEKLGNPPASTVADFSYTISNNGYAPCEVTFTNSSLNAGGYLWNFGNGLTSTDSNPVVIYDSPGLYTVTLTCTAENNVYYNKLVKTLVVNIKDPMAGLTQVLYFTSRNPEGGGVHLVYLTDGVPQVQDFEPVELSRPYGIAVDTAHSKVYVSDYSLGVIYRFDADGKNPVRILDYAVPGQEIVDSPEALMVAGDKLYWGRPGGIYRCNLDGTSPEVYINTEGTVPEYPIDMQYDEESGKIYLVNDRTDYTGGYFTCDFTGSGMTEVIPDIDGTAIEVDTEANKVYMAVYPVDGTAVTEGGVYICNTDGSGLAKIGDYGSKATWGMTIDQERNKLFWGYKISNSNPDGKIIRSNLDGSGQEDWLTGVSPHAMQIAWIKL